MSKTTIQGANINVSLLNQNLVTKLETALESIDNPKCTEESKTTETALTKTIEKWYKCNETCKSKAVLCQNGHWVHYLCDKLSEHDIQNIEKRCAGLFL